MQHSWPFFIEGSAVSGIAKMTNRMKLVNLVLPGRLGNIYCVTFRTESRVYLGMIDTLR